jgi:hypothetical protein
MFCKKQNRASRELLGQAKKWRVHLPFCTKKIANCGARLASTASDPTHPMRSGTMPTTKTEEVKKHGDTLEPLIDRTGTPTQRKPSADDDTARRQDGRDEKVRSDG